MHAKERKSVRVFSGVPRCRSIAQRRREALETKPAGIAELCVGIATAGDVLGVGRAVDGSTNDNE